MSARAFKALGRGGPLSRWRTKGLIAWLGFGRRSATNLAMLDEHLLRDIGLGRRDLEDRYR